jgi:hypothetical protein
VTLHSNLLEITIYNCSGDGIREISSSLVHLTSLSIFHSPPISSEDLDSISKLTNLERIVLVDVFNFDELAVADYSVLRKIKSIRIEYCVCLSGLGFCCNYKELLVQLQLYRCDGISSEGYHSISILSNLTYLTFKNTELDDIGLNMFCSSCLHIEHLQIEYNYLITVEGLNNIHCLYNLNSIFLTSVTNEWLAKLSHNTALINLNVRVEIDSTITNEGLNHLSSLVALTSVMVERIERLSRRQ